MKKIYVIASLLLVLNVAKCQARVIDAFARLIDRGGENLGLWVRPAERQLLSGAGALLRGNFEQVTRAGGNALNDNNLPEVSCERFARQHRDEITVGLAITGLVVASIVIYKLCKKNDKKEKEKHDDDA